jgi:hypothetical protein
MVDAHLAIHCGASVSWNGIYFGMDNGLLNVFHVISRPELAVKLERNRKRAILIVGILLLAVCLVWLWKANKLFGKSPVNGVLANTTDSAVNPKQVLHPLLTSTIATSPPIGTNKPAISLTVSASTNQPPVLKIGQISASALKQISALEAEKAKRTPVQQKIDTQLLYADKMLHGLPIAEGVPTQRVDLDKDDQSRILVDIKAEVTASLLQYIKTLGGNVINEFPQFQAIRAAIPLENIESLAARSEVKFIQPAVRAMNNNVDSEGDYTHQAITARSTFGVNGSGLKIGVLSDSVDYLSSSQIAGKITVLSGQSGLNQGNTGEGTAMLEIVNDLAPGGQLYFATALGGEASFANNIQQLQAAGCNIIVDDELYNDESPFQDGIIAQAVNSVIANGVLYFSAASNAGNKDDETSGTWEGDFVDGGNTPAPLEVGRIHNFTTGVNANTCLGSGPAGNQNELRADLFWSDPLGASTNDYDLYVLNSSGTTVVASSLNRQTGTQNPYESVGTISNGELIVIVKYSGSGRFLHLSTGRGLLSVSTQGSTRGHDCATNAFNIAAVNAYTPYPGSPNPYGPYPYAFTGGSANPVEIFSSDGPRRVFYQANGAPITPGNFSSTGGAVRQKPDITAADGVTTDVSGFAPFYGTSAAAPHAAAIAALLKSYNTNLTAAQIRMVLTNATLDIMSAGWDRDSGAGIVMPLMALQAVEPDLTRQSDNLNNLTPYAGDTVTASLTITNTFCSLAGNNVGTFHVGFYWSTSATFIGVSPFYEAPISGCAANGSVSLNQNILISAGNSPGTYYLGYKINDENEVTECDTGNNGIYYWTVTVLPPPQPDLTRETDNLNNLNPHPSDTITASITITNESCTGGSSNAGPFHVGFYWSTSSSFSGVSPFYEAPIAGCVSNGIVPLNQGITISAGTAPGIYYLGYEIDNSNEVDECNGGDNLIYSWPVTVTQTNITSPTMKIGYGAGNAVLSWPTNIAGFMLEYASNLPTSNWFTNSSTPSVVNGQYTITNPASTGTRFYRLLKP